MKRYNRKKGTQFRHAIKKRNLKLAFKLIRDPQVDVASYNHSALYLALEHGFIDLARHIVRREKGPFSIGYDFANGALYRYGHCPHVVARALGIKSNQVRPLLRAIRKSRPNPFAYESMSVHANEYRLHHKRTRETFTKPVAEWIDGMWEREQIQLRLEQQVFDKIKLPIDIENRIKEYL